MEYLILVIISVQIASAVIVYLQKNEILAAKLSTSITLTNFFLSLFLLITGSFGKFTLFGVLEFYPDRLGLLLGTYILLVSSVVHKYAENYMKDDPGYKRFYILLDLITTNLILLVTAGNLLLLFFAWHIMGILLFFMLNHNYKEAKTVKYANLSFITHRLADIPLLIAIVLLFLEFGTLSIPELEKEILSNDGYNFTLWIVPLLVVISAMLKSAQIPFHLWLVYSMEGPTPVSALMHAGIVNAGAFLVNRLAFTFTHENLGLHLAFFVGSLTAIIGSALMLIQNDVKKALGYSTVGQMGYMVMEFGIGAFALAVYHMMAHGIFKATLFLYSGNVIHSARKDPNIPEDEVYKMVTKGHEVVKRVPWFTYALLSILIPLLIVILVHLIVEEHFLKYETQLIILFFAWATAAQVVISTFRAERERPLLTAMIAILSLLVFLLGYVVIGHGLTNFLYPHHELVDKIYEKSFSNNIFLYLEMVLIALIIFAGWIFIYYASKEKFLSFNLSIYTHLSRELYLNEVYDLTKEFILKLSGLFHKEWMVVLFSLPLLFYIASEVRTEETLFALLIGFLIPILPTGYITVKLLKDKDLYWYILLPLLGVILLSTFRVPEEVKLAGVFTFLFFTLRSITAKNFETLTSETYGAVLSLVWVLQGNIVYIPVFMASPIILYLTGQYIRKQFGHTELGFITGLFETMPKFSLLLILSGLYIYGMPLLISFKGIFEGTVKLGLYASSLFLLGWVLFSVAIVINLGKLLFYKPSYGFIYRDLDNNFLKLGLGLWLLVFFIGFLIY